ncbi:MAG TPA: hypothetical protein VK463_09235 [Desulfomonilaceae bacterium]|nr:hypothetical protein [Desulfomonilaceae bacterium]
MTGGIQEYGNTFVKLAAVAICMVTFLFLEGCGVINVGKWKGIETTGRDESYYLVKDVFLTPGSAYTRKDSFDHSMNESVNLVFTPRDERNHYVAESKWFDPSGQEFRTIRKTYDVRQEAKSGEERTKSGTVRMHTMSTKEMVDHKPGMWKVELYLDDKLARRLTFSVR